MKLNISLNQLINLFIAKDIRPIAVIIMIEIQTKNRRSVLTNLVNYVHTNSYVNRFCIWRMTYRLMKSRNDTGWRFVVITQCSHVITDILGANTCVNAPCLFGCSPSGPSFVCGCPPGYQSLGVG